MTRLASEGFPEDTENSPSIEIGYVEDAEELLDGDIGSVNFIRADGFRGGFITTELSKYVRGATIYITSRGPNDAPRSIGERDEATGEFISAE